MILRIYSGIKDRLHAAKAAHNWLQYGFIATFKGVCTGVQCTACMMNILCSGHMPEYMSILVREQPCSSFTVRCTIHIMCVHVCQTCFWVIDIVWLIPGHITWGWTCSFSEWGDWEVRMNCWVYCASAGSLPCSNMMCLVLSNSPPLQRVKHEQWIWFLEIREDRENESLSGLT